MAAAQRELGVLAARTAALLRSDIWAQVILRRELSATDHATISQKLWKASLMALEPRRNQMSWLRNIPQSIVSP